MGRGGERNCLDPEVVNGRETAIFVTSDGAIVTKSQEKKGRGQGRDEEGKTTQRRSQSNR